TSLLHCFTIPRLQPRSTLFPYTTLFRSREAEIEYLKRKGVEMNFEKAKYSINKGLWGTSIGGKETLSSNGFLPEEAFTVPVSKRSEEHTSELQSRENLVCRLLLEKKNTQ